MSSRLCFLVDANVPKSVVRCLRDLGHDVADVREILPNGAADQDIFDRAQGERRIIVTHDLGFGNLIAYPPGAHAGIITIRPQNLSPKTTARIVCSYVRVHADRLPGAIVTLSPRGARVRMP